jgi:hypothetical protein
MNTAPSRLIAALLTTATLVQAQEAPPAAPAPPAPVVEQRITNSEIEGGYRFTIETTEAPDLTDWATTQLLPVVKEWYPKIVELLPSEGFTAPRTFSISFTNSYKGVAATMGNRIVCDPTWYRKELKREALGSVVHELVHVVQQYRGKRGAPRPPFWLQEGIPDYIRWYLYEPQSRGCEIPPNRAPGAKHDAGYRISANFLNWAVGKFGKDLIKNLNAATREGRYNDEFWQEIAKSPLTELADQWRKDLVTPPTKPAIGTK